MHVLWMNIEQPIGIAEKEPTTIRPGGDWRISLTDIHSNPLPMLQQSKDRFSRGAVKYQTGIRLLSVYLNFHSAI